MKTPAKKMWLILVDSIKANIEMLSEENDPMENSLVLDALTEADQVLDTYVCNLSPATYPFKDKQQ